MSAYEPQLGNVSVEQGTWRFERAMDIQTDPYLLDHVVEGLPVLPAAYLLGLMTQAAHRMLPHRTVRGVRNVRFVQAARFKGHRSLQLTVTAEPVETEPDRISVVISSRMAPPRGGSPYILRTHASGEVLMGEPEARAARFQRVDFAGAADYAELYALPKEIRHGPAFLAGVCYRHRSPDQLLAAVASPGRPQRGWQEAPDTPGWPSTLLNAVLHVGFSLGVLSRARTLLPLEIEAADLYAVPQGPVQVFARRKSTQDSRQSLHVVSWDERGRPVGVFRGFALQEVP
ncbi:polyketide synthase dehydratase domain-containing protein [Stigmatella hybrida]|uniref:polyketide synthase dehydratase domain-containing protein n=1 Tax=Stigmatella hybrida TaxID=394097 RepID=UPI001CDADB29|nr:polyketide synthase dehydratase domain-containing protein [Stigmatella hybrida]